VRGFLNFLWMALLLVAVALVSALVTMRLAVHGREVNVPDVRGKTPVEARNLAEDQGLSTDIERQYYSETVPQGRVLSQTPAPGSTVRRGWEVRLAVSLGPQRVTVPQVVGQSQRAANIVLQQRGLENVVAEINLPGAPAGQVLAQDPPASATEIAAPRTSLLVSQESSPAAYLMPNFVGKPLGSSSLTLKDAGFSLGKVTVAPQPPPALGLDPINGVQGNSAAAATSAVTNLPQSPPPSQPGTVPPLPSPTSIIISQDPAPGQKILAGSPISFVVR
jgi:eukaryotic-like serine/threonine-protein kinase